MILLDEKGIVKQGAYVIARNNVTKQSPLDGDIATLLISFAPRNTCTACSAGVTTLASSLDLSLLPHYNARLCDVIATVGLTSLLAMM